ncbi:hypothetical protein [Parendozoicomonas haliclonae]|uniref:Uncharacterized protein n=1 Tax=Parendozoicomonas haliclonae TaxID=1960125 RepID=A0A1X7AGS6_9GAMM|nr:hypothetical protein [Parendozoicomonas haliclonae]SMA39413.1 hypothetical protein EHSB41UT_01031 [Parendozoicomonas haliclonae]
MQTLAWNDTNIPHQISVSQDGESTLVELRVVKDVEPEVISLAVCHSLDDVLRAWEGAALPVSEAFDDGNLYSQVRVLFNLKKGCVVWLVNHIKMPNGQKMSADKLAWVPAMHAKDGKLVTIQ